ncbi:MAG TPA: GDYXXLXY domain-containing protein [Gemmatales bacterium]|nr:GDYXXLXY domain-containing protein [Gemmatales bacterium]
MPDSTVPVAETKSTIDRLITAIKGHERLILLATVALQLIVLIAMIVLRVAPLMTGETILVQVEPVDPRDMFRGDYVILSYAFSRLPPNGIVGLPNPGSLPQLQSTGNTVYVTLVPDSDGRHWHADQFSYTPPSSGKYLRGTLTDFGRIEYGIESYFVQEGKGRKYEEAVRARTLSAEIAVTSDGQAVLKRLVIE